VRIYYTQSIKSRLSDKISGKVSPATIKSRLSATYYESVTQSIHRVGIGKRKDHLCKFEFYGTRAMILSRLSQTCLTCRLFIILSLCSREISARRRSGRNEISMSPTLQKINRFSPSTAGTMLGARLQGRNGSAGRRTAHVALFSLCSLDAASNHRSFIRKSAEAACFAVNRRVSVART